jgi:hypothetical protein
MHKNYPHLRESLRLPECNKVSNLKGQTKALDSNMCHIFQVSFNEKNRVQWEEQG